MQLYINENSTLKSLISMEFFLFFLRKFSQLHALLEPPGLLIFEKPATDIFLCYKYQKKSQLHALLEPPRLFDFGKNFYLHVIRTPRLLETYE
jgi:hypothetical protein